MKFNQKHALTSVIFIWALLVSWHPFFLGFYHDDWAVLGTLSGFDEFRNLLADHPSRPLGIALYSLARYLIPFDAFYYQLLLALLVLLTAVSIYLLVRDIARKLCEDDRQALTSGAISAIFWMVMPWTLANTVWPITFTGMLNIVLFTVFFRMIVNENLVSRKIVWGAVAFTLGSLISETFWFAYIPAVLMNFLISNSHKHHKQYKEALILFTAFSTLQILLGVFNRLFVYFGLGINRSININFMQLSWSSLKGILGILGQSTISPSIFIFMAILWLLIIGFFSFKSRIRFTYCGLFCCVVLGVVISIGIFSLAGYGITSIGLFARTTSAISIWIAIGAGLGVILAFESGAKYTKPIAVAMFLSFVFLATSSVLNVMKWIEAWHFEIKILQAFPVDVISKDSTGNSLILIDAKKPIDSSEGFESYWDITGALAKTYPKFTSIIDPVGTRNFAVMLDSRRKITTYDGVYIRQAWCNTPHLDLWKLPATGPVFLWSYEDREIKVVNKESKMGCL